MSTFTDEEYEVIKLAVKQFSDADGYCKPADLKQAMLDFQLDQTNPVIFDLIASLDTPANAKTGLTVDNIIDALTEKLNDRSSKESIDRSFELILGQSKGDTIDFNVLRACADSVGDDLTDDQIRNMIAKGAENGKSIGYDEFSAIMAKKVLSAA